ncbi:aminotransferase class V-fold PLP-dependent enzyme [Arthrobacter crusticola]|uniref:Aminotransferase class V-fold PLP-dependent enzyme n=1 Tax=Arthrobacter crusticola TaxID=2547960 RepID=A0A4V3AM11_9MICC|nr:aminotransferase class V-fold PLP-dependent enzyme [Arthrobacter crusticola]TDK25179.1 aminotransferase class V-fold PLP-dependent enzyme [Arthrobacter crusticola]
MSGTPSDLRLDGTGAQRALNEYLGRFREDAGYLNFASYGPPSRQVVGEAHRLMELAASGADSTTQLHSVDQRAIAAASRLSGFPEGSIDLLPSTSHGLFQLAFGLAGGGEVLVAATEFPANLYPWWRAQEAGRITVRLMGAGFPACDPPPVTPELIRAHLTEAITAVAVSAVDFRTGFRVDLPGIREAVGDRLLIVDGIQGFGVSDLPWTAADAVVVGGQKWLRAGWGCGFLALSDRTLDRLDNTLGGWTGVQSPTHYDGLEHPPADGARRFSVTNGSPFASGGLASGLELLETVGVPALEERIAGRTTRLLESLQGFGVAVGSPLEPSRRAGIVVAKSTGAPAKHVHTQLAEAGITTTLHAPDRIRVSLHATTTDAAIDEASSILKGLS